MAMISLFTALAITTDYAMLPLANIKLMDTIVFVSALVFGLEVGVSVGALTWLVYGSVNPLGAAGGSLLIILIASETVYAFLGCAARKSFSFERAEIPTRSLFWGSLGLLGAFLYDLNTIITPTMLAGVPFTVALATLLPAVPFMMAHEISDFIFFATVGPVLVSAILKVARSRAVLPKVDDRTVALPVRLSAIFAPIDIREVKEREAVVRHISPYLLLIQCSGVYKTRAFMSEYTATKLH